MCRQLKTVTSSNLSEIIREMNDPNKTRALLINTRQTSSKIINKLDSFGCGGYNLTSPESRKKGIETLTGLMSIPENCGKVFCEIV
ncbi:hypothetical protein IJ384_01170 [bacterium]|nr:hypothetical protein [bacterium]